LTTLPTWVYRREFWLL